MTLNEETRLVDVILGSRESLPAADAINAFLPSRLPPEVLAQIWEMTESGQKGYLSRDEVLRSVRLLGWAQRGFALDEELADRRAFQHMLCSWYLLAIASPLVTLDGLEIPPLPGPAFSIVPPLSPANRAKYEALFDRTGPEEGRLDGMLLLEIQSSHSERVQVARYGLPCSSPISRWISSHTFGTHQLTLRGHR